MASERIAAEHRTPEHRVREHRVREHQACRECRAGQPHCHGTLVCHPWGQPQCTDPECSHPELLLHSLRIDCDAAGCECAESERRAAV